MNKLMVASAVCLLAVSGVQAMDVKTPLLSAKERAGHIGQCDSNGQLLFKDVYACIDALTPKPCFCKTHPKTTCAVFTVGGAALGTFGATKFSHDPRIVAGSAALGAVAGFVTARFAIRKPLVEEKK